MKDKIHLVASLVLWLVPLLSFLYFMIYGAITDHDHFGVVFYLVVFVASFFIYIGFFIAGGKRHKKELFYFTLIVTLAMFIYKAPMIYEDCFKEPSKLVDEIITTKFASKSEGNITKFMNAKTLEDIKRGGAPYLTTQEFNLFHSKDWDCDTSASFKRVVKKQHVAIIVCIKNAEVEVIAFTGYNAL